MKILWYVNALMPDISIHLGFNGLGSFGWLIGYAQALSGSGLDLNILALSDKVTDKVTAEINGITYIVLPKQKEIKPHYRRLIEEIRPDIVHIFGTEYSYNTDLINYCAENNIKSVVSIQGIMYLYAERYMDGLPEKFKKINPFLKFMKKVYMADSIALGQKEFALQGEAEITALKNCINVIGRTAWDKKGVLDINPALRYFHVNENLRKEFYNREKWSYDSCEKHSIFISQAFYPIKGFHRFLPALKRIKDMYPDVKVYVSGQKPFSTGVKFLDYFVDFFFEYQRYIKKLIKKYGLEDNIEYLGFMNASQMVERYKKANVFVSASTIENSPNSVGEAMYLGTPVVASDVGGTSSMLTGGEDGILCNFFDVDGFVSGIKSIFDDSSLARKFSDSAIRHARVIHDGEKNAQDLINTYRQIVEEE